MSEKVKYYETKYWEIILHKNQAYLGYSIVKLKSRAKSMSDISKDEWVEFQKVVKKLEYVYKETFNAEMFNWTCLMNAAYKKNPPQPWIHWHFRPRYRKDVKIGNDLFQDLEFAHHYNKERQKIVSKDILEIIAKKIKKKI